jgi:hypothetical protein
MRDEGKKGVLVGKTSGLRYFWELVISITALNLLPVPEVHLISLELHSMLF